jgi:hypothetical protein
VIGISSDHSWRRRRSFPQVKKRKEIVCGTLRKHKNFSRMFAETPASAKISSGRLRKLPAAAAAQPLLYYTLYKRHCVSAAKNPFFYLLLCRI